MTITKNKFIWAIGVILVAIISLPLAHAIPFQGTKIWFLLINTAVIGIILFLLQSLLLPDKPGKEKTVIWIIILVASFLIAFLYGQTGLIWNVGPFAQFFSRHKLVNSLIISSVLYFILVMSPIGVKLQSKPGQIGAGLLIFIFSSVWAVNIGDKWIWSEPAVKQLIGLLFNKQNGILNPQGGLFVFIGSFVLLSFFFNGFLLKGGVGGKNTLNYLLALVLSISMASQGAKLGAVIQMGEILLVIMFAQALEGTVTNKSGRWILAIVLVSWFSAALTTATPEYRGLLGKIACKLSPIDCDSLTDKGGLTGGTMFKAGIEIVVFFGILIIALKGIKKIRTKTTSSAPAESSQESAPSPAPIPSQVQSPTSSPEGTGDSATPQAEQSGGNPQ